MKITSSSALNYTSLVAYLYFRFDSTVFPISYIAQSEQVFDLVQDMPVSRHGTLARVYLEFSALSSLQVWLTPGHFD
jgi:hypothetical protein